jgi:hypothetical protein
MCVCVHLFIHSSNFNYLFNVLAFPWALELPYEFGIPSICGLHEETVGSWHVSIWYLKNRSSCGTNIGQKLPPARVADILQGTLRPPYCHTAKSLLLGTGSWLSVWWKKLLQPVTACEKSGRIYREASIDWLLVLLLLLLRTWCT